jgi:hypothetical protein
MKVVATTIVSMSILAGCQGFHSGLDGLPYDVWTYGDLWSPGFTAILNKDGTLIQVIAGESAVGQISTGAGIAISGIAVAERIDESGDNIDVSQKAEGGTADADAQAILVNIPREKKRK